MERVLRTARASGSLNLSNRSLAEVPPEVYTLLENVGADEKWWEAVELQKLILAHNTISKLSEDLGRLSSLTLLNVSNNQLSVLPASIRELTLLKVLDVSNNKISELPAEISAVTSLTRLQCANNSLVTLPHGIGNWKTLTQLKVPNNLLTEIPEELGQCVRLVELDLEGNKLTRFPDTLFSSLTKLTELNAGKNALKEIPPSLGGLKNLIRLDLHQNRISEVPAALAGCSSLVELYLGDNIITSLPPEVGGLSALSTFDLHTNQLKDLPTEICSLQLSMLDVSNNNLSVVPPELGNMTSLRKLLLIGNPLRSLRSSLISGPTPALLKFLRGRLQQDGKDTGMTSSGNVFASPLPDQVLYATRQAMSTKALSLSGKGLICVPSASWQVDSLTSLDLSRNEIQELPNEISTCTALEVVLINDNKVGEWPGAVLSALPNLRHLVFSRNPLHKLPDDAFASMEKLQILDLSGVSGLLPTPPALSSMRNLQELHLSHVQLREVPGDVADLVSLQLLNLSDNYISVVPEALSQLTLLQELNLTNNSISSLNPKLGLLEPTLRSLKLDGNPIRSIRRPILERGTKSILQYLRNKL